MKKKAWLGIMVVVALLSSCSSGKKGGKTCDASGGCTAGYGKKASMGSKNG